MPVFVMVSKDHEEFDPMLWRMTACSACDCARSWCLVDWVDKDYGSSPELRKSRLARLLCYVSFADQIP
jgi:hypothetical protein